MTDLNYDDPAHCVFCKIVSATIPAEKIYEDEEFLGFLDLHPAAQGHALLIPKSHVRWVHDVEPFGKYWEIARIIARKQESALDPRWIQYLTHGAITHAHIHIIPRYDDVDSASALLEQPKEPASPESLHAVAEKIRKLT
jgi:histidine triad (HIT) family protein